MNIEQADKQKKQRWTDGPVQNLWQISQNQIKGAPTFLSIFCTFVYKIMLESQDRTDWGSPQGSESGKAWPGQSQLKVLSNWNTLLPQ